MLCQRLNRFNPALANPVRSTTAIRSAFPTFCQERNWPCIPRQICLPRKQSHPMDGGTGSTASQLEPRNIDAPRPWQENTMRCPPCTHLCHKWCVRDL
ncbi:hypothetical protein C1H46_008027 [Malus baccata]|uniref:Uncharacterized protein n=1 Tax=Malus baccata TaxID=106549 RepID=A0A540N775_MALBA|nr:hypothetical protein C1H46_008027 [Malus baccata]